MPQQSSLLSYVRSRVTVDVDSMDPAVAARHTAAGDEARHTAAGDEARFCDMTSNQAIVFGEVARPDRVELLKKACSQIRSSEAELDIDTQVADTIDLLVCPELSV